MSAKTTPADPVQEAFDNAPIGEPETEEERRLVAEARESRARGDRTYSPAEIKQAIEEMRRKHEGGSPRRLGRTRPRRAPKLAARRP